MPDNLLTVVEAAKILGCSPRTVKARVESKRLRSSKVTTGWSPRWLRIVDQETTLKYIDAAKRANPAVENLSVPPIRKRQNGA